MVTHKIKSYKRPRALGDPAPRNMQNPTRPETQANNHSNDSDHHANDPEQW